jgi:hypothetical protein
MCCGNQLISNSTFYMSTLLDHGISFPFIAKGDYSLPYHIFSRPICANHLPTQKAIPTSEQIFQVH